MHFIKIELFFRGEIGDLIVFVAHFEEGWTMWVLRVYSTGEYVGCIWEFEVLKSYSTREYVGCIWEFEVLKNL